MLREGKIKENALKRSVLKEIKTKRADIVCGSGVGEDALVTRVATNNEAESMIAISSDPVSIPYTNNVRLALAKSINNLAVKGAIPIGVLLNILLPLDSEEADIKFIMREAEKMLSPLNIQISGGHTEATGAVNNAIITATTFGSVSNNQLVNAKAKPGDDIILTKWIGLEGTAIIADINKTELFKLFPKAFVEIAVGFSEYTTILEEAQMASDFGVSSMHDVSTGGIFSALWEMAERSKVGLDINLQSIPVRQETIEICEVYGLNPYELTSAGCLLITCENGSDLIKKFDEVDLPASIIGKVTSTADRILRNDEEIRYLDMPKADEILKIFNR